jgi:hypothetical protein
VAYAGRWACLPEETEPSSLSLICEPDEPVVAAIEQCCLIQSAAQKSKPQADTTGGEEVGLMENPP